MAANIEDQLKAQLTELFSILQQRNIPYVLVGGIAMLTYIEGRNTTDVDLVLSVKSLDQLPEIIISSRDHEFARGMFGNLQVDLLLTANPLFRQVEQSRAVVHRFLEMDVRCATIEGLIVLKLFALPSLYLQGNFAKVARYEADIAILYQLQRPDLTPLVDELAALLTQGQLDDLHVIIGEIKQRVARLDRTRNKP